MRGASAQTVLLRPLGCFASLAMTDRESAHLFRGVTLAHEVPAVLDLAFGVAAERAVGEVFGEAGVAERTASRDGLGSWRLGSQASALLPYTSADATAMGESENEFGQRRKRS
jgi:hypothetical protein